MKIETFQDFLYNNTDKKEKHQNCQGHLNLSDQSSNLDRIQTKDSTGRGNVWEKIYSTGLPTVERFHES